MAKYDDGPRATSRAAGPAASSACGRDGFSCTMNYESDDPEPPASIMRPEPCRGSWRGTRRKTQGRDRERAAPAGRFGGARPSSCSSGWRGRRRMESRVGDLATSAGSTPRIPRATNAGSDELLQERAADARFTAQNAEPTPDAGAPQCPRSPAWPAIRRRLLGWATMAHGIALSDSRISPRLDASAAPGCVAMDPHPPGA